MMACSPTPGRERVEIERTAVTTPVQTPIADVFLITERPGKPTTEQHLFTIHVTRSATKILEKLRAIVRENDMQPGDEVRMIGKSGRTVGRAVITEGGRIGVMPEDKEFKNVLERLLGRDARRDAAGLSDLVMPPRPGTIIAREGLEAGSRLLDPERERIEKKAKEKEKNEERARAEKLEREIAEERETLGSRYRALLEAKRAGSARETEPKSAPVTHATVRDIPTLEGAILPRMERTALRQEIEAAPQTPAENKLRAILLEARASGTTEDPFIKQLERVFGADRTDERDRTARPARSLAMRIREPEAIQLEREALRALAA